MFSKTHKDKGQMSEGEVSELCPRIFELGTEFNKQSEDVKNRCFLETLLKGSFSLLAIKSPQVAFQVSSCNIHLFFELFGIVLRKESRAKSIDFKKVFNFLFETVRGLLIYAKEGKFD
jgi:hypothetical protein